MAAAAWAMASGMEGRPRVFLADCLKISTMATAKNRAMVGFFRALNESTQVFLTFSAFMPWRKMVMMATSMKGMVPGR